MCSLRKRQFTDFLYLSMNPVQRPETFGAFVKAVHMLDAEQKQRLIVSLDLNPNMGSKDWKRYQKNYQTLRSASIQKIGINNYQSNDGERVQHNLYQNLSLNGSPRLTVIRICREALNNAIS